MTISLFYTHLFFQFPICLPLHSYTCLTPPFVCYITSSSIDSWLSFGWLSTQLYVCHASPIFHVCSYTMGFLSLNPLDFLQCPCFPKFIHDCSWSIVKLDTCFASSPKPLSWDKTILNISGDGAHVFHLCSRKSNIQAQAYFKDPKLQEKCF